MARKKQKLPLQPAEQEYEVIITSEATVKTIYRLQAVSPEEALRMATSGEYEPDSMDTTSEFDRYAEVDGKEMDLET